MTVVPVNCICPAEDHFGQAVHPIFPHRHGESLAVADDGASAVASPSVSSNLAEPMVPLFDGALIRGLFPWLAITLLLAGGVTRGPRTRPDEQFPDQPTGPPRLTLAS